jgi:hypothetical protein
MVGWGDQKSNRPDYSRQYSGWWAGGISRVIDQIIADSIWGGALGGSALTAE